MTTNHDSSARIFQINLSDGGVPKLPVRRAEVRQQGIVGDRQRNLKVHGGPERAVCLFSLERIQGLQAEGHPAYPGSLGENVTISGLDWTAVAPGSRLRLGNQVLLEVTRYTTPCDNLIESFMGGDFSRLSQEKYPGWARVYTRVVQEGEIQIGDRVVLSNG